MWHRKLLPKKETIRNIDKGANMEKGQDGMARFRTIISMTDEEGKTTYFYAIGIEDDKYIKLFPKTKHPISREQMLEFFKRHGDGMEKLREQEE